ncbi:Target of rapamycin complex 2 subunit avo2 [Coniosporium tulheliwenetii]|uniref:Target of rapamycin complex 2 subunit avo2 n=1 Tax=Coniosporium tulheliwenetii TaxID=3383036 RepID=A0ACC2ZNE9_9PEZI|nr:Target of rapamycin complex 2 subunit avo2 [Cladosporium sp. JES 115]
MLASKHGLLPLLPLLLTHPTHAADPNTPDHEGNTALHYASAAGELKALRVLLSHGADPGIRNVYQWPPVAYSATVAAEQYFATLIKEVEQRRMDAVMAQQQQVRRERERERQGKRVGAVRLVTERDEGEAIVIEAAAVELEAQMGRGRGVQEGYDADGGEE